MDTAALKKLFSERGIRKVKVGGFDIDGVLRGKYVSLEKFWSAAESGFGFCDVIFGWDITDVLYDNAKVTGWQTGYPDAHARIDLDTFRVIPAEPDTAAFLVDFCMPDGSPHPACPRSLLKKVIAAASAKGLRASLGSELEFWVFRETPESIVEKGHRGLTPVSPGMFGYSWLREEQNRELCHAILDETEAFDISLEALHTETGPGVYEAAIRYDDALRAADKAALFKTAIKSLCGRHGLIPTFMAKWSADLPGSSGHIHQSLWSVDGKVSVFHDAQAPDGLSALARHYLGGQLALLPALTAVYSPTINSYKRYVPGVWAPLNATWGMENRTCAIRAIAGGPKSTRLELRQTAADMNPYLSMAAAIGSGLWGIDHKVACPPPSTGDASADATHPALPLSLEAATAMLAKSDDARAVLGEAFVDHYTRTREWECRQYARAVTDWELRRYFESI
ncbi:MAG: glutamine synthetase [Myxococcales bacterium]|nr:glutamine synthetase [Myxococcales bacterium]